MGSGFYLNAVDLDFGRSVSRKSVLGVGIGYYNWLLRNNNTISFGLYYKYHFAYDECTSKRSNWYLAAYMDIIFTEYKVSPNYKYWLTYLNGSIGRNFSISKNLKIYFSLGGSLYFPIKTIENSNNYLYNNSEHIFGNYIMFGPDCKLGLIKYF